VLANHSRVAQHLEVMGAGGLADRDVDAATAPLPLGAGELADDLAAHRVAEGVQHLAELDVTPLGMADRFG
jgi:hypothetical protein